MMDPICAELEKRLLFDPTMVIRIPHLACYSGGEIRNICRCRESVIYGGATSPSCSLPNIEYVTLRWYEHTAGFLWIGKCEHCGIIYFTVKTRR